MTSLIDFLYINKTTVPHINHYILLELHTWSYKALIMWHVPLSSRTFFCLCVAVRSCPLPIYCELERQRTSLWSAKMAQKTWKSASMSWTSQPKTEFWHPRPWTSTVEINTRHSGKSRWTTFLASCTVFTHFQCSLFFLINFTILKQNQCLQLTGILLSPTAEAKLFRSCLFWTGW